MVKYLLTKKDDCRTCKTKGSVRHKEWIKFYEAYPEFDHPIEGYEDEVRFNDMVSRYFITSRNVAPPQRIHCPDCGGHGAIRSECDLVDALKKLSGR